jgi:hypothetical protein
MSSTHTDSTPDGKALSPVYKSSSNVLQDTAQLPAKESGDLANSISSRMVAASNDESGTCMQDRKWCQLFDIMRTRAFARERAFFSRVTGPAQTVKDAHIACMLLFTPSFHENVVAKGLEAFGHARLERTDFSTLIFPCCGMGIYEISMANELLRCGYDIRCVVFMDRALLQDNDFCHCRVAERVHLGSFQSLASYVLSMSGRAIVVGFNALTTHPCMYNDPHYSAFIHACWSSEQVHDQYLLVRASPRTLSDAPDVSCHWLDWQQCWKTERVC